jgi:choline dehydrogenase
MIQFSVAQLILCSSIAVAVAHAGGVPGSQFGFPGRNSTYDYVVVGAGTAGLTIATRLAQRFSVAVIEAGSFIEVLNGNGSVIPGLAPFQGISLVPGEDSVVDWNLNSIPQAVCV